MVLDVSPSGELWRRTLSQIPSTFGRLVYLASLRDPNTGEYQHFGFAQRFSEKEADRTLRRSHADMFADWLCFSLEQQKEDLEKYLNGLSQNRETVIENWKSLPPFAIFVPPTAKPAQKDLFLSDLSVLLELFP